MATKVIMPQLGESVVEGTVTRWLKQEGEAVREMDSLLEVNTDKVDTEIPSPAGGMLLKILVPEGQTVQAGTIIAWIGQAGEEVPGGPQPELPEKEGSGQGGVPVAAQPADQMTERTAPQAQPTAESVEGTVEPTQPLKVGQVGNGKRGDGGGIDQPATVPAPGRSHELGFISPIVAKLAQEKNIDLTRVTGTGEGGRITKKDVLAFIEQSQTGQAGPREEEAIPAPWETPGEGDLFRPTEMVFGQTKPAGQTGAIHAAASPIGAAAQPSTEVSMPGEGQVIPLNPMRRKIAEHMATSVRTSPHVTTVMEADLHRMIAHYNANQQVFSRDGVKLTYTAYFSAAAAQALRQYPLVNSSWSDAGIRLHPRINLGLAVSLGEEGLIVPVLKDADGLSLLGLARAIGDIASRARSHQLKAEEVQGGTFTITNHGISGSLFATPIINQPQCAILGVGLVQKRVVVIEDPGGGDTIAVRPMVYLSLTFDHRILDGASADGFLAKVVEVLENWSQ